MRHDKVFTDSELQAKVIDIRTCACGSIHIYFFGRTTFHLSHQEFLDFSKGVSKVSMQLKEAPMSGDFNFMPNNGFSH